MKLPLCQDTGIAVFFADVGDSVRVDGEGLGAAINEGARQGYRDGALRMSVVKDPLRRGNTGDNTPAIIHYTIIPGETIRLSFCPKGAGSENMSRLAMLNPGDGREGVVDFVLDTVRKAGGNPCPPVIIGIGLGGDFEYSAMLSKRALMRTIGSRNPEPYYRDLETELLQKINDLGIGPMGLGGSSTALDVFIETAPCHIASLPVAVNVQCHSARHGEIVF
jgi:fumarate hydratase subunit alpha